MKRSIAATLSSKTTTPATALAAWRSIPARLQDKVIYDVRRLVDGCSDQSFLSSGVHRKYWDDVGAGLDTAAALLLAMRGKKAKK